MSFCSEVSFSNGMKLCFNVIPSYEFIVFATCLSILALQFILLSFISYFLLVTSISSDRFCHPQLTSALLSFLILFHVVTQVIFIFLVTLILVFSSFYNIFHAQPSANLAISEYMIVIKILF